MEDTSWSQDGPGKNVEDTSWSQDGSGKNMEDTSWSQDGPGEGSSVSVQEEGSPTHSPDRPSPKVKKKGYKSIFKHNSSSESDSSESAACSGTSPDKKETCQGILENLIKSEIHKINQNFNVIKKRRKRKITGEIAQRMLHADQEESETDNIQSIESADSNVETGRDIYGSEGIASDETNTLTAEETERFASIAKDLDILNTHGGATDHASDGAATKLYTGPYGRIKSPFKKFSSFKSFSKGIKRSPRKWPGPSTKRPRLLDFLSSSDSDHAPETEKSPELVEKDGSSSEGESSDESHCELRIVEESDHEAREGEMDEKLTAKSEKFSLSAINVKSIIHKIITNENVVEMVRKAIHEECKENDAKFEPKMTRAKVKQTMETDGVAPPHLWGISPRKNPPEKSSFLDIDLPEEEEDDEDFNPEAVPPDSDEDSESVLSSSCLSDLDSTMPSTPTTPRPVTPQFKPQTPTTDNENSQSLLSPMGPPLQIKVPKSNPKASSLARKFQEAMEKDEARQEEEEELIARRTRSKLPLNDLSVFDLEANLVAPDITEDLYDTSCDDSDWRQFLYTLVKPDPIPVTEDSVDRVGDDEDPEYNYQEEVEKEKEDMEDFRDDRAVKVSKKELNLLMDELHDAYGDNDPLDAECRNNIKTQTQIFLATSKEKEETNSLILQVGEHEKRQIDDQMRKHVQLLAQTFVMAQTGIEEHKVIADTAQMYLTEMSRFAELSENTYRATCYRACNLQHAVDLIKDPTWQATDKATDDKEEEVPPSAFKYENLVLPSLSHRQMKALWTSPCFMFPELLPHGSFFKMEDVKRDRARVKFLEAEDNLLAMGLEQFKHLNDPKMYIHQFMLPCKSKKQIQIRIKNLNAKAAKDNPVKFWKQFKQLPIVPQCAPEFDVSMMMAVADRDTETDSLPTWCQVFRKDGDRSSPAVNKMFKRKRSTQSSSFSITSTGVTAIYIPPHASSAPVTPCHQQTDSSHSGSSGSSLGTPKSDSQAGAQRPLGAHRKKLDLDGKEGKPSGGVFVPLTMPGQTNPITICMVDKLTSCVTTATNTASVTSCSRVNTGTCIAPTIIFINNTLPVATKANIKTHVESVSSTATQSIASENDDSSAKGNDTLQTALLSANILDAESSNNNASVPSETDMTTDTGANDTSTEDAESLANEEQITAEVAKAVSEISNKTVDSALESSAESCVLQTSAESWSVAASTPTRSVGDADDLPSGQMTPEQMTPNSTCSSTAGTPKSAIEIMASYAPYFISPSDKSRSAHQQHLETTPKKSGSSYTRLAPKPTPPSGGTPTKTFKLDKKITSPRRKQLQQKARSILPKGFVVSKFDNSPTKRAASSLIDKAKHVQQKPTVYGQLLEGFRKILPHPPESERVTSTMDIGMKLDIKPLPYRRRPLRSKADRVKLEKRKFNDSVESMEVDSGTGEEAGLDDREGGDTESDVTQSEEEGEETQEDSQEEEEEPDSQEEEPDSQEEEPDSQEEEPEEDEEEEAHIANLMHASTTVRSDFSRDEVSKVRLCKKDRDRDTSLAMLAPDIIESDPQRDYRDTAFAQAYLHKVKKALRDDMDTLEKFLHLMYNFSKTTESPVKLYRELSDVFEGYPELMTDFAGFLLPEQAIVCDCYNTHNEFNMARTFLRKLEVYFSKAPHQFQKVMKTFSRWYRKPGRRVADLREQVEPMLKGQRYLLEEFSRFFPDEPPPESVMDDFEEIDLKDSGDEECRPDDSSEEVELLDDDDDDTLGTKRCPCTCHDIGDDNYRKKKKHCYRCCLTVIDGELVYRVNKSTIKRVNVTFGPSVRAADFIPAPLDETSSTGDIKSELEEAHSPCFESEQEPDVAEMEPDVVEVEPDVVEMEPDTAEDMPAADWMLDTEGAEKENIENYHLTREIRSPKKHDKVKSSQKKKQAAEHHQKPQSPQKMSRVSWPVATGRWARLSDAIPAPAHTQPSHSQPEVAGSESMPAGVETSTQSVGQGSPTTVAADGFTAVAETSTQSARQGSPVTIAADGFTAVAETSAQSVRQGSPATVATDGFISQQLIAAGSPKTAVLEVDNSNAEHKTGQLSVEVMEQKKSELSGQENSVHSRSGGSSQPGDILATAFSSAMMTEVSLDSMSMPFSMQTSSPEKMSMPFTVQTSFPEKMSMPFTVKTSSPEKMPMPFLVQTSSPEKMSSPFTVQTSSPEIMSTSSIIQSVSNVVGQCSEVNSSPFTSATVGVTTPSTAATVMVTSPSTSEMVEVVSPKPLQLFPSSNSSISAPDGKDNLKVSSDSNFLKVQNKEAENTTVAETHTDIKEPEIKSPAMITDDAFLAVKSPVFSPFSPYASEVQAINSMGSPLTTISSPNARCSRASSGNKIRRITPIQVSDHSQQSNSSFQSVVENSPIIIDNVIHGSPFEKFGRDMEDDRDKTVIQPEVKKAESNSIDKDVQSSKSDSMSQHSNLLSSSQRSDSTVKSSTSDSGEGLPCNIKISEPVTHSEDANKEFPAVPASSGTLLTEESLLHCLGKDAKFDDHLHSISNLTNILHALEEKTVHGESSGTPNTQEKSLVVPEINTHRLGHKHTVVGHGAVQASNISPSQLETSGSDAHGDSSESDVSDKTLTPVKHPPDTPGHADNQRKMEEGNFNVTKLSDSDSSYQSSSTNVTPVKESETNVSESKVETSLKGDSCDNTIENASVPVSEHHLVSHEEHSDWTYKPKHRDKAELSSESSEDNSADDEAKESMEVCSVTQTVSVSSSGDDNAIKSPCNQEKSDNEHLVGPSGDNQADTPVLSSCDSGVGKSKRHKDKHKKKKSKKRQSEKSAKTVLDKMKKLACTSVGPGQMSPSVYGPSTSGEQSHESSAATMDIPRKVASPSPSHGSSIEGTDSGDQASSVMAAADLCSNISSPCSSSEGPEWSKDTDKTILEACKVHGIREKTFVKIAKQIGNVTPKQVRKRFGQLYRLILKPMSKQAAKDTTNGKGSPAN